ncbi:MAG: hypothetical protein ACM3WV_00920 [Bacillota bacterium]
MKTIHFAKLVNPFLIISAFSMALFTISGAGFAETRVNGKALLKVTILIFSGRPNPCYFIEEQRVVDNLKMHFAKSAQNRNYKKDTVIPNILGYQGIIVENLIDIKGLPKGLIIHNNDIEVLPQGIYAKAAFIHKEFRSDTTNNIETFLLDYGVSIKAYSKELRDMIKKEYHK